jgi:hypothetical protein
LMVIAIVGLCLAVIFLTSLTLSSNVLLYCTAIHPKFQICRKAKNRHYFCSLCCPGRNYH